MIIDYIIIAIFVAWIWIDYFRLIDIFEREQLGGIIATFVLGGASVLIVDAFHATLFEVVRIELNGNFINDFLYSVFAIGAIEELAKLVPFLIIYYVLKDKFNEPVDHLIYISVSALGFSAVENVLYMSHYGAHVVLGRSILASVGHMFDTSLIAYGLILYKYKKKSVFVLGLFFFLAALSHGFYDFWLIYDKIPGGFLITIAYFLITISLFATILNNSINNSSFFTYKKAINQKKVISRLLTYYLIVFFAVFITVSTRYGLTIGMKATFSGFFLVLFIVTISIVRLSRFRLIKGHWFKIKIEFPFTISKEDKYGINKPAIRFRIKGDSFNEAFMSYFFNEYFYIKPLHKNESFLERTRVAYIEDKLFVDYKDGYYLTKIFYDNIDGPSAWMLIRPKAGGRTSINRKYPIAALLKFDEQPDIENLNIEESTFKFVEWVILIENE